MMVRSAGMAVAYFQAVHTPVAAMAMPSASSPLVPLPRLLACSALPRLETLPAARSSSCGPSPARSRAH